MLLTWLWSTVGWSTGWTPGGPISKPKTSRICSISRWAWPSVWWESIKQWQPNVVDPVCLRNHSMSPRDQFADHLRMYGLYLKCSMTWLTTCQIIMKRKRLPDARCQTVQEKLLSFVTSATSTCALCHNETASRLLIKNQSRWKYQQTDVFSVQVQFHSKLTCYHHIHSFNHKSCVHVHVQMRYFSLFLQAPSFFGEYLTAVPYPCCDAPIKFMRMFRTIHRLKHMQTFSSRCLGHTWLILWGKTLYYFCFYDILRPLFCDVHWNGHEKKL